MLLWPNSEDSWLSAVPSYRRNLSSSCFNQKVSWVIQNWLFFWSSSSLISLLTAQSTKWRSKEQTAGIHFLAQTLQFWSSPLHMRVHSASYSKDTWGSSTKGEDSRCPFSSKVQLYISVCLSGMLLTSMMALTFTFRIYIIWISSETSYHDLAFCFIYIYPFQDNWDKNI